MGPYEMAEEEGAGGPMKWLGRRVLGSYEVAGEEGDGPM